MAIDQDRPNIPEVAVSASAAIGGVAAVFAWAACCVLPLALSCALPVAFAQTASAPESVSVAQLSASSLPDTVVTATRTAQPLTVQQAGALAAQQAGPTPLVPPRTPFPNPART